MKEVIVRTKSDPQWSHPSGIPGCHRCGLPLLVGANFCPYCERRLRENGLLRALDEGRRLFKASPEGRTVLGVPETALLAVGIVIFTLIAIGAVVAAVFVG